MYTDHVLEEKERIQKEFSIKANYDVNKLLDDIHKNIIKFLKEEKSVLKYSDRKGGYVLLRHDNLIDI